MAVGLESREGPFDVLRRLVLGLMWKVELAFAFLVAAQVSFRAIGWAWLSVALLFSVAAGVVWQFVWRRRPSRAAWSFVLISEFALLLAWGLASSGSTNIALGQAPVQGLPLYCLLVVAGLLLPPWAVLPLLGVQILGTVVLPHLLYAGGGAIHLWGALPSVICFGLGHLLSKPLSRALVGVSSGRRHGEGSIEDQHQMRRELQEAVQVRDAFGDQLNQANSELARQMALVQVSAGISRIVTSALDIDELLSEAAKALSLRLGMYAALYLVDEGVDLLVLRAASTSSTELMTGDGSEVEIDEQSALGAAVLYRQPHAIADVHKGEKLSSYLQSATCAELAMPLIFRGEILGALDLQSSETGAFADGASVILSIVADQIASAIANVRSFGETLQARQEIASLQRRYVQETWESFVPQLEAAGYRFVGGDTLPLGHRPLPEVTRAVSLERTFVGPDGGLVVPISFRGQVIGALGLNDPDVGRQWTEEDVNLVESVSRQMSMVIDNARLVEETRRSLEEIRELNRRYVREAWESYLPERGSGDFVFAQPGVRREAPLPPELDQALATNQTIAVRHQDREEAASALIAPINLRDQMIGALGLQEMGLAREWTVDELALVDAVADQMSWAVENARLFEEAERRAYELEVTARQLRETDQFRAQFLANMSHELRTPLNSIIGFSRVILKGIDGPLTELQKTDLEAIYSNGQYLLTMINEILDMSKIEAGGMELIIGDVDVDVLVRSVIAASTALVKDRLIELRVDIQENLPMILADETRIRQVVTNLMSNAAKFTQEGSITVSVWSDEEMVYVSVEDTGEGIPEDKVPLVFEAFRQVDGSSTRRAAGTGLGLPISRELVELHGGSIWFESEYGVGSKFVFCVPIKGAEQ